jgi:hypothetical protein
VKAWKYLVLLAGIAGVVGFFLPFIHVTQKTYDVHADLTALQLVRGADGYVDLAEHNADRLAGHHADAERFLRSIDDKVDAFRGFVIGLYAPAALLALIGLVGCVRGKYGRLAGLVSLALGLASAGIWLGLMFVSRQEKDPSFSAVMGTGLHLLLVAGAGGIVAGFGALVSPDR